MTETRRCLRILLVEDNPADVDLTLDALAEGEWPTAVEVVNDGEQALAYLRGEGEYAGAHSPDLILLDLNLPRRDGHEVLEAIKKDSELQSIPVIILTTSTRSEDILSAYEDHANCYITKPVSADRFMAVIRTLEMFWCSVVQLPGSAQ